MKGGSEEAEKKKSGRPKKPAVGSRQDSDGPVKKLKEMGRESSVEQKENTPGGGSARITAGKEKKEIWGRSLLPIPRTQGRGGFDRGGRRMLAICTW